MTNGLAFLVLLQTAYSVVITRREINLSPTLYGGRFYQSDDLCMYGIVIALFQMSPFPFCVIPLLF